MVNNAVMGIKGFVSVPLIIRFWSKVDKRGPDECWPWLASLRNSRGIIWVDGKHRKASQIAWELANGKPFPAGMDACHSCDNPPCVNPSHIWPGTARDNALDASRKGRLVFPARNKTHCQKGHPYSGENLYITPRRFGRRCRTCNITQRRDAHVRVREAALKAHP